MPIIIPYIPESITVHLGMPASNASNMTVSFVDYIKNVASGEIYPTWNVSALRANILAQISFALNRVYTEYYRSRGYNYDITNSTAYDQAFSPGRNIFDSISQIVDDIFNDYIRRQGFVEPLFASFCNGTTVTCSGLSQWGSESLAQQGYNSVQIIKNYYGDNIELVTNAPIQNITSSYPGTPLRQGDRGANVVIIQVSLNRISQNYPAIPKINPVDGIFNSTTTSAVKKFQDIFGLVVDGIVGKATWYQLVRLYVAILRLAELNSLGQTFTGLSWDFMNMDIQYLVELNATKDFRADLSLDESNSIGEGDSGTRVSHLQFMLAIISQFNPRIPMPNVNGNYDEATKNSVLAFQQLTGIQETGRVDVFTWDAIYNAYAGMALTILNRIELFPFEEILNPNNINIPSTTSLDSISKRSIVPVQNNLFSSSKDPIIPIDNFETSLFSNTARFAQFPGHNLRYGMSDHKQEVR